MLIIALSPHIATDMPYAVYILPGLSSWFYAKEILSKSIVLPRHFLPFMRGYGYHPILLSCGIALSSLPTLLIWSAITCIAAAVSGLSLTGYYLIPYLLLANFLNAVTQSFTTVALAPLFPRLTSAGLRMMLLLLFWTSPIIYPAANLHGMGLFLARLNPLYYLCESMRGLTSGHIPSLTHTAMYFGFMLAMILADLILVKLVHQRALAQFEK